jgi:S-adenosylmethionine:diacylglycerol 3-amino-3-carboxypropyl transferase
VLDRRRRRRWRLRLRALHSGIAYTRVFEDGETDRRAVAIVPGARILVIASAGDRALDATAWGAGEVIAVDRNPAQLRLTALKVAAAGVLDGADLVALFSEGHHPEIRRLYAGVLRARLGPADRTYWDRWIDVFEIGLHTHHPLGRAIAAGGALLRLAGGRTLRSLVRDSPDPAAQGRLYERRLRRRYWNPVTRWILGRRAVVRWFAADRRERQSMLAQRFHEWLEPQISHVVATSLVRENPYWMPILAGRPAEPSFETAWLRPTAIDAVRSAPARIRLVEGSVVDALAALPAGSLDTAALSNVPDWLAPGELARLWDALAGALVPGGRVVLRSTLRSPPVPTGSAATALVVDEIASSELTRAERTGIFASVTLIVRSGNEADAAARDRAAAGSPLRD